MSLQYAAPIPVDASGQSMQEYPNNEKANTVLASDNATASSVITLNDNTTVIEVAATGGAAAIRWVPPTETAAVAPAASVITAAGTANFDHIVPSNTQRRFVVPVYQLGTSSVVGANVKNGLYSRVAVKSVGVSSVATMQF